jgi:hypothetical protein
LAGAGLFLKAIIPEAKSSIEGEKGSDRIPLKNQDAINDGTSASRFDHEIVTV